MYSKVFAVLAVAAFANANDLHQNLNNTEGLKPVFQGHYVAEWTFTGPTKEVFVNVSGLITGINVTDLRPGKDGVASIVSGGVGHENVTVSFKSPAALRGYDFMLAVFADEKEIEKGSRGVEEPEDHLTPENTTASVPTSTTGKPTEVTPVPTVAVKSATKLEPSKPRVTTTTTTTTGKPDVTGYTVPSTETGHHGGYSTNKPKQGIEIPEDVPTVKIGYAQSTEKHF